jgi:hypothetical protein
MLWASRAILATLLLSWAVLPRPLSALAERGKPDADFGSITTTTRQCSLARNGSEQGCTTVQLTQRGNAGLRIRFIGSGAQPGSSKWITFIARHRQGIRALSCNKGSCEQAVQHWSADVISASIANFDDRGLPVGLPNTSPMDGECQIERQRIQCVSRSNNGLSLRAVARL